MNGDIFAFGSSNRPMEIKVKLPSNTKSEDPFCFGTETFAFGENWQQISFKKNSNFGWPGPVSAHPKNDFYEGKTYFMAHKGGETVIGVRETTAENSKYTDWFALFLLPNL